MPVAWHLSVTAGSSAVEKTSDAHCHDEMQMMRISLERVPSLGNSMGMLGIPLLFSSTWCAGGRYLLE